MLISFYNDKMVKKWLSFAKWPSVFFLGQRISKMAKFFEIGHKMVNLATLAIKTIFNTNKERFIVSYASANKRIQCRKQRPYILKTLF